MNGLLSPVGRFATLLVATDGTEYSSAAEKQAEDLALRCNSHLILARIVLSNPEYEALAPERLEATETAAREQMNQQTRALEKKGIRADAIVRVSLDPYQEIVRLANEYRADLVIIGRRNRSDLARLLIGDSTAKVIGLASCSVMVVPRGASLPTSGILLAIDGSRLADMASVSAIRLAQHCKLPLTAVTVVWPASDKRMQHEGSESLQRVQKSAAAEGLPLTTALLEGQRPEQAIIEAAEDHHADLIVVGSHGRTGLQRLLMGSVSERVIGGAGCSVLVVKAPT